jgi:actin-like ATPase involved in cell morphogenesis/Tfp pilus assembly protein PilZ
MADDPSRQGGSPPPPSPREQQRFGAQFSVGVMCRQWSHAAKLVTLNASRGGVFIRADQAPPVGGAVRMDVELPNGLKLALSGTVAHVITPEKAGQLNVPAGFGIKFDADQERDLLLLEAMARSESNTQPAQPTRPPAQPDTTPVGRQVIQVASPKAPIALARVSSRGAPERELPDAPCTAEVIVGIDYGTTYSSIAAVRGGEAYVVRHPAGHVQVPSLVSYPEAGGVLVGWDARERLVMDPSHTVYSAKRLLGRQASDPAVVNHLAQAAYPSSAGPNGQVLVELQTGAISIPQVVAEVLRLLKRTAERAFGVAVEEAVLTVPVHFEVVHRNALRKAAQLAGLRVVGLIEEPAAALLAYGLGQGRNETVAVYDYSGGTFDFTVIDTSGELSKVLVAVGDPWLGGDDFDLALATDAANDFWRQTKIELQKRRVEWQRLVLACEAAKRALTDRDHEVIEVPGIARQASGPIDLRMQMTRARFEVLCADLLDRSLDIMSQSLTTLGLQPEQIGQVVLTGGVTRIPTVRRAVARFFKRELSSAVNPDEAIALGAALQAAFLTKKRSGASASVR